MGCSQSSKDATNAHSATPKIGFIPTVKIAWIIKAEDIYEAEGTATSQNDTIEHSFDYFGFEKVFTSNNLDVNDLHKTHTRIEQHMKKSQ